MGKFSIKNLKNLIYLFLLDLHFNLIKFIFSKKNDLLKGKIQFALSLNNKIHLFQKANLLKGKNTVFHYHGI